MYLNDMNSGLCFVAVLCCAVLCSHLQMLSFCWTDAFLLAREDSLKEGIAFGHGTMKKLSDVL